MAISQKDYNRARKTFASDNWNNVRLFTEYARHRAGLSDMYIVSFPLPLVKWIVFSMNSSTRSSWKKFLLAKFDTAHMNTKEKTDG